ncbi:MAG: type I-E CRISPR-associated protein Cas6/Cse3/CasE [Deltaproteobacteria bacterium]|nr:type I-E CRISPR-associated protein Cas6/Cse3/CasE [Deltaproteobacteria bacterium]
MEADALHLLRMGIRWDALMALGKRRHLPLHTVDEGYLVHCFLAELWKQQSPRPFRVRQNERKNRFAEVWAYSRRSHDVLADDARLYADPQILDAVDWGNVHSKPMPSVPVGKTVGFELRACPVVRNRRGDDGNKEREVDAWLARCHAVDGDEPVDREQVYREWLQKQIEQRGGGAMLGALRLVAFKRDRLLRREHGGERTSRQLERPGAHFEGTLTVQDSAAVMGLLSRGIGRHRAFGFGMLVLVPPRFAC